MKTKKKTIGNNDIFTPEKRSAIMAAVRSKNTAFEKKVFAALRKKGLRFKTNYAKVTGKPDIVLIAKKKAVFLDSDFWHGWRFSLWRDKLTSDFWKNKIEQNRKRDKKVTATLRKQGWQVLRIWEHQIKKEPSVAILKIEKFIKSV